MTGATINPEDIDSDECSSDEEPGELAGISCVLLYAFIVCLVYQNHEGFIKVPDCIIVVFLNKMHITLQLNGEKTQSGICCLAGFR